MSAEPGGGPEGKRPPRGPTTTAAEAGAPPTAAAPDPAASRFIDPSGLCWAALFARLMLGLFFFMLGWGKVFGMGPAEHARRFFTSRYADSWIPHWLLLATGTAVPFIELIAGLLLIAGLAVRAALLTLAGLLLLVTYGHLLADPFFDVTTHILPRALLLLVLLVIPRDADRWSLDRAIGDRT